MLSVMPTKRFSSVVVSLAAASGHPLLSRPLSVSAASSEPGDPTSAQRLLAVRDNLRTLSDLTGRPPARLVAVSKTYPASAMLPSYDAGQRVFGENYVQEIIDKAPLLPGDIQWHFIGHLQTNKVQRLLDAVPNLWCVESVSSAKLATQLDSRWADTTRKLRVFVQVNTSAEESKDGVEPEACAELVRHVAERCKNLELAGLMTIGKLGDSSSACFDLLAKLRDETVGGQGELSMGMSGDYELAVRCGSTNVRVGSSIFGSRAPKG